MAPVSSLASPRSSGLNYEPAHIHTTTGQRVNNVPRQAYDVSAMKLVLYKMVIPVCVDII